jgi:hypothetical protein
MTFLTNFLAKLPIGHNTVQNVKHSMTLYYAFLQLYNSCDFHLFTNN